MKSPTELKSGNIETDVRSNIVCSNQLCSEKFSFPSGAASDIMVNVYSIDDFISTSTIGNYITG